MKFPTWANRTMSWNLTENHQGENLSHSGYGAQQVQSDRIMLPGLPEYLKLHIPDERVVGIDISWISTSMLFRTIGSSKVSEIPRRLVL